MPRPKRAKVAPSAPAPRVRKVAKAAALADPTRQAPSEGFNELYDISDPVEETATSARLVKRSNAKGKAVAGDQTNSRVTGNALDLKDNNPPRSSSNDVGSDIPNEEALWGEIDLESSSPAVEIGRRDRGITMAEGSIMAIGNFGSRPGRTRSLGRTAVRARSSSLESNMADNNGLMSVGGKNNSASAIGNFKRRPREPSLIRRNAATVRSSSIGLEMDKGTPAVGSALKIRNFKRRAREPSILRTTQKDRQLRPEYDDEDEDDFHPEDESTPLNLSKSRTLTTSSAASNSNIRKRKLSPLQVPQSSPTLTFPEDSENQDILPATALLNDEEEGELPTEDIPMPSIETGLDAAEAMSETMAPPQSSSPSPSSPQIPRQPRRVQESRPPSRGRRPIRGRAPLLLNQDSPPSSPPSLTHSPNRPVTTAPKPKAKTQTPAASTFSTAQLQALLPRRRRRGTQDPFDIASSEDEIDVSGLGSDDDELTHSSIRAPPRTLNRRPVPIKKPAKLKAPARSSKSVAGKGTYGSKGNVASDKENEVDPDDSLAPLPDDEDGEGSPENSQELEKRVGKELKKAARKFKEVDEWELDFEEVTASSSSPKDAR